MVLAKFETVPGLEIVLDSSGLFHKPAFRHLPQNLFSPAHETVIAHGPKHPCIHCMLPALRLRSKTMDCASCYR